MAKRADVVIVGAGPAGLSAGIVLARNRLRVLICDPRPLPIDKACGEGVLPHGLAHLRELDVVGNLNVHESYPFRGIRFRTAGGASASACFAEGPGLGIRRLNLSRALAQTASNLNCLEIRQTRVLGFSASSNGVEVELPGQRVSARLLIGADGLNSRIRRWAGLEGGFGRRRRFGTRQHFQTAPWSDHVEVFFGHNAEAYVTPCGADAVGVAFLWDKPHAPHTGGRALVDHLLSGFGQLQTRLRGVPTVSSPLSTGPLYRKVRGRCADGVLLLGDAGGYLDACTGEGISLALAQALCLERTLVPLLQKCTTSPSKQRLQLFDSRCRDIMRPYVWGTSLLLFLNRHPRLLERFVKALAVNEDIMEHFFSALMGKASFWLGWSKLVRLLPFLLPFSGSLHSTAAEVSRG
ncbi:MAG TPA: NAD(P)/FAD-dependent oxidoreductase [Gemmataceae bacterium]|jgi:flavin-dependent dehydrogenase